MVSAKRSHILNLVQLWITVQFWGFQETKSLWITFNRKLFCKKLHRRCLLGFWISLWVLGRLLSKWRLLINKIKKDRPNKQTIRMNEEPANYSTASWTRKRYQKKYKCLNPFIHNVETGQTYSKTLAVSTPKDFQNMFGHFSTLYMKGLNGITAQKMKFFIKNFFCKGDQIRMKLQKSAEILHGKLEFLCSVWKHLSAYSGIKALPSQ